MNTQQKFDYIMAHLFKQGIAAIAGGDMCAYHAPDGMMCAVGCLISDEDYSQSFEQRSIAILNEMHQDGCLTLPNYLTTDVALLMELQVLHDDTMPRYKIDAHSDPIDVELYHEAMRCVANRLAELAIEYELTFNEQLLPEIYRAD